jgi:Sulfatase
MSTPFCINTVIMKFNLLFLILFIHSLAHAQPSRPNIIVFLVDDMGWQDTSVPFWKERTPLNKRYHTPNMERLAQAGMKFTAAYATPVCTPTRVSMLAVTGSPTGHHPGATTTQMQRTISSILLHGK